MLSDEEKEAQKSTATGARNKVGQIVLEQHIQTSFSDAIKSGNAKDRGEKIEELMKVFRKYGE